MQVMNTHGQTPLLPPPIGDPMAKREPETYKKKSNLGRPPKRVKMKCLVAKCKRVATTRGLCPTCYYAAKREVERGNVTWDKLVSAGLALMSNRRSDFMEQFARSVDGKGNK